MAPHISAPHTRAPHINKPHLSAKNVERFEHFVDLTKSGLSFGEKFTYHLYRSFSEWPSKWFTHVLLLLLMVLYTVFGAFIFSVVEGHRHNENIIEAQKLQKDFFDAMRELSYEQALNHYSAADFDAKMVFTLRKHQTALEALLNINLEDELNTDDEPWSFTNAIFYCGTVYTTIGYGNIAPTTTLGRFLTIIYAIIGIPLYLVLLVDYGKILTRGLKSLCTGMMRLYYTGSCRKRSAKQQARDSVGVKVDVESQVEASTSTNASQTDTYTSPYAEIQKEFHLPISVALSVLIGYLLIITTLGWRHEDWTYFETIYFVFISITTIGFGDFVPTYPSSKLLNLINLFFGLIITFMVVNATKIKLNHKFKQAREKIAADIGLRASTSRLDIAE